MVASKTHASFYSVLCIMLLTATISNANNLSKNITQHIAITFNTAKSIAYASCHISVPAGKETNLFFGQLQVTGSVLKENNKTPKNLILSPENRIFLQKSEQEKHLYFSWELAANNYTEIDTVISKDAIILTGFWHPQSDQDMLFSLEAEIPDNFSAVTESETIKTTLIPKKNTKKITAFLNQPLGNIHFIAGPYIISSKKYNNTTIHGYFFIEDQAVAMGYIEKAAELISLYEGIIGPFPYSHYRIVENKMPTGYAMPTFTLLGQAVIRLPFIINRSLGHEILHSWLGNAVSINPEGGNWAEGFTTYLADHLSQERIGKEQLFRKKQLQRYEATVHASNSIAVDQFKGVTNPIKDLSIRSIGYDKASMLFHMLRQEFGDETFYKGVQDFYQKNRFKRTGWSEIKNAFENVTNRDLTGFFSQWLQRKDIASLTLEKIKVDQKDGKSVISFNLVQLNEKPYELQIPLQITTISNTVYELITVNKRNTPLTITTQYLPTSITLDPDYSLMRKLGEKESAPTWKHFLGAEQKNLLLPSTDYEKYRPLVDMVKKTGGTIYHETEVSNAELQVGNWIFCGQSTQRQSIFADRFTPLTSKPEFSLSSHFNPLNHQNVIILADSSSVKETKNAVRKLRHYGGYSNLLFNNGRLQTKQLTQTSNGLEFNLFQLPNVISTNGLQPFSQFIDQLIDKRVVYIGETHTDYGAHLLQLQIIQALASIENNLVIGMEMFPRSSQQALDNYISKQDMSESDFIKESKYFDVWGYDYRLYREIINFAKENTIPLAALNTEKEIPKAIFSSSSTDTLTDKQLDLIPQQRDLTLSGYSERISSAFNAHHQGTQGKGFGGFIQAQAIWDETMAKSIVNILKKYPDKQLVVLAGSGHVNKRNAIPPRVTRRFNNISQHIVIPLTSGNQFYLSENAGDSFIFTEAYSLSPQGKLGIILENIENGEGVRIMATSPHGHAKESGLEKNDIIRKVNSDPITSVVDLKFSLMDSKPEEIINIGITRAGKEYELAVRLSDFSSKTMMPPNHPKQ